MEKFFNLIMDNNFNKEDLLPSISENILCSKVYDFQAEEGNIRNTDKLSTTLVIYDKDNNGSLKLTVKDECHELDFPPGVLRKNRSSSTSPIKIEPKWDPCEIEHLPDHFFDDNKTKDKSIVQLDKRLIENNDKSFLDLPEKVSVTGLDGFNNISHQHIDAQVKTENCNIGNVIANGPENVFEEWKIKSENVYIKDEGFALNEIRFKNICSQQIEAPVKTENCKIHNKIEIGSQVLIDGCKMKQEMVDLKEDNLDASGTTCSPGRTNQEEPNVNKKHKCLKCRYQTNRKYDLGTHLLKHKSIDEVRTFSCSLCKYESKYKGDLKRHSAIHENPKEEEFVKCDICEYRTWSKPSLQKHSLSHKSSTIQFRCTQCDFISKYKQNLTKHVQLHKNPETVKILKCNLCPYRTHSKCYLKIHALRHKSFEEVDTFYCSDCGFKSKYKKNLSRHAKIHKTCK